MAKSRRTRRAKSGTSSVADDPRPADNAPPFPAHLPDPPRKNPWFLGLAVGLLTAWLLALVLMSWLSLR